MTMEHSIYLAITHQTRHHLLREQISFFKHYKLRESLPADLVIYDTDTLNILNTDINSVILPKGPLRLGDIMDRIHYALSGRNHHIEETQDILLGDFLFRPSENGLIHLPSSNVISLTDKERLLLRVLYEAPQQTLDRATLLKTVWQYAETTETHTFETHLYRLRQKLEPYHAQGLIKADGDGNYSLIIT